jgi:hypothetical protein
MGRRVVNAVFDTNVLTDLLKEIFRLPNPESASHINSEVSRGEGGESDCGREPKHLALLAS